MDTKELLKRLVAARDAISLAVEGLQATEVARTSARAGPLCVICGNGIGSDDKTMRGRHIECYNRIYAAYVKTGEKTLDDLEKEGLIDPPAKTGRKPKDSARMLAEINSRIRRVNRKKKD